MTYSQFLVFANIAPYANKYLHLTNITEHTTLTFADYEKGDSKSDTLRHICNQGSAYKCKCKIKDYQLKCHK